MTFSTKNKIYAFKAIIEKTDLAGFEPATFGLEVRCPIHTRLQVQ